MGEKNISRIYNLKIKVYVCPLSVVPRTLVEKKKCFKLI